MGQPARASKAAKLRANEAKWGAPLVDAGWTLIPSTLLEQQKALELEAMDMNILLQLARYWWQKDNPPHPAIGTIALCLGVHRNTVQRRITKLKKRGLIEVQNRKDKNGGLISSSYTFEGLIRKLTPLAKAAVKEREENRRKRKDRLPRKGPKLKVVTSTDE